MIEVVFFYFVVFIHGSYDYETICRIMVSVCAATKLQLKARKYSISNKKAWFQVQICAPF